LTVSKQSALKSALILSASSIGLQLLGFGYRIFISRVTGAEGMGVFQLVMPVYSVLYSITLSGLCTAVTNIASGQNALGDGTGMKRLVRTALTLFVVLFTVAALPAALFSGWISVKALGDAETRLALLIMLPCLFLTGFENIYKSWFYGVKNVKPPAISDQLEQIVRIAAVAALLLAFPPEDPAMAAAMIVAGMTVSETFSSVYLAIRYRRAQPRTPPSAKPAPDHGKLMRKILAVAIPISASSLVGNIISSANTVLVPQRLIAAGMAQGQAVGVLGVVLGMATPLFMLPMAFIGPLVMVMLPRLSEGCAVGNMPDVHRKIGRALHVTGIIALPAVAVMAPMGRAVCELLYGQVLPQNCFYLLAAASVFIYYQTVTSGVLNGIGRQNTAMVNTIAGGVVQLAFTWFAVSDPRLGINGYLLGVLAGSALSAALNMECLIRRVGLRVQWGRWFAMPVLSAAVCGLTAANVWTLAATLGWESVPSMAWSFAAGLTASVICVWIQGVRVWRYIRVLLPQMKLRSAAFSMNSFYY
jgi:stage V sporulation protein B